MRRNIRELLDGPQARQRHYYRAHKSLGKCARCSNPPLEGKACCQDCLDKMTAGKKQARELGLCLDCWKEPAVPGTSYCAIHLEGRQRQKRKQSMARFVQRLCLRCGKKRAYGRFTLCKEHLRQRREQRQRQRVAVISRES